jgi:predicted dehydrogenase
MEEIDADPPVVPWGGRPWHVAQDSVLRTNREMLQAVQQGRPAATSAEDNYRTFALVEAAYLEGRVRPEA